MFVSLVKRFFIPAGIVPRLRLVFAAICLPFIAFLLFGNIRLAAMNSAVDRLASSATRIFIAAEDRERILKELLLLLPTAQLAVNRSELDEIAAQIETMFEFLHRDSHTATSNAEAVIKGKIDIALGQIQNNAEASIAIIDRLLDQEIITTRIVDTLEKTQERALQRVQEQAYQQATRISAIVDQATDTSTRELRAEYLQNFAQANTLSKIGVEIGAIVDIAVRAARLSDVHMVSSVDRVLEFRIVNLATLLSTLRDSTGRSQIATEVNTLRGLIFADANLLDTLNARNENLKKLSEIAALKTVPIQQVSAFSQQLTDMARDKLSTARDDLVQTSDALLIEMAFICLTTLLVVACALYFIVEKQINRRMAHLTTSVLKIADGDIDYQVTARGHDEIGRMASALGVFKNNAKELVRSNEELEKFAYVAAHDLRSPLRAITQLSEWIEEDPDNKLSEDSASYMGLMRGRVDRLSNMLSDILEYAQVGKDANNLAPTSIRSMVENLADMLSPDGKFSVHYNGIEHEVTTYATPLQQLLLNLISNAIKHHDRDSGRINIQTTLRNNRLLFEVHDDGPGIAPKYHKRIFELFQTLLSRDEVEGSGLGLAIIRKTVESFDGKIVVQSDPEQGRGTKFIFDFPELSSDPSSHAKGYQA